MNDEFNALLSKFYDLGVEDKKKEIFDEFNKISEVVTSISSFKKDPASNSMINYDPTNQDSEDDNLVKIYNDLLVLEEKIVYFLKDKNY